MIDFRQSSFLRRLRAHWKLLVPLLLLVSVAAAIWWFWVVPRRVEQFYGEAVEEYRAGDYAAAVRSLERAYALDSRAVRVNILLGWSHWRLGHAEQAEFHFARAHRLDPAAEEARLGLAYASLALGKVSVALPFFQELAGKHPDDKGIQLALGEAYVKSGQNLRAARFYRDMVDRDHDPDAEREFLALYGYQEYVPTLPLTLSPFRRPPQTQIYFRTHGDNFQALDGETWKDIYIVGVNIGPARPGEFPSSASRDFWTYMKWFMQIGQMNANTVRAYTVLPPAFYQALKAYNESVASPLYLVQEVWIPDDAEDLYESAMEREFREETFNMIDLLHGQADLPYRKGHNYGIYTADVSRYVLALAIGREIDPRVVQITNDQNPTQTAYQGRNVSLPRGNPTEAWLARMCDLATRHELEKYNSEHPLTIVNWPPLDPLVHPTESTYREEIEIRKKLGESISEVVPRFMNDADVVSVDIKKFKPEAEFTAGLFALYHIYQHWPDFLLTEPSYAQAHDAEGPNRYLGYLRELKKAYPNFPLFVGEYGLSSSLAPAHLQPQGWNNGGLTEQQQADLLVRFTRNIRDTGYAGGLVFEWQDEWFKHVHDSYTADFERPWDRNPLWLNELDPEKCFGIVGYEPSIPVPLLRGEPADWQNAETLYSFRTGQVDPNRPAGQLRAVYAMADFAFLYLFLDVEKDSLDWTKWNYWIALNTLPDQSGSKLLPDIQVRLESGANFLIQLSGPTSSSILIAQNYNPNQRMPLAGRPDETRVLRKQGMNVELAGSSPFEEIFTEANAPRYARDGRIFPALDYNRSPLPYGTADRARPDFSSHALWHADADRGMIELRIPWGLLFVTDPSDLQVFGGTDSQWMPQSRPTKGISVAVFALRVPAAGTMGPAALSSSLPPVRNGEVTEAPAVYSWRRWDKVEFRPYLKKSFSALQNVFEEMTGTPIRPPAD